MTQKERAFLRRCLIMSNTLHNVWENNHDKKGMDRAFMLKVVAEVGRELEIMKDIMNRKESEE